MGELVVPSAKWADSFRAALIEAAEREESLPWDPPVDCSDEEFAWHISQLAAGIRGQGHDEPTEFHRWWVEGETYVGRSSLRYLNVRERTTFYASHGDIGYDVRPSARGRGAATAMLLGMLALAKAEHYPDALITCDIDNVASRRVLEKAGGIFLDQYDDGVEQVLRYRFSW